MLKDPEGSCRDGKEKQMQLMIDKCTQSEKLNWSVQKKEMGKWMEWKEGRKKQEIKKKKKKWRWGIVF